MSSLSLAHFLLQGIFVTQGSNPGLPHCRQMLYHLSQGGLSLSWNTTGKNGSLGNEPVKESS